MIIQVGKIGVKGLGLRLRCGYHIEDLLKRVARERKPALYAPANHLYIDNLLKYQFNEKKLIRVFLEQQKMDNPKQGCSKLFQLAYENIQKITQFKTIINLVITAYELDYEKKDQIIAFGNRAFEILKQLRLKNQQKPYSYETCKLMISLSRSVGLNKFTDEQFDQIMLDKFKPLFLMYILQLFWQSNLQDTYKFPKKVLQTLVKNQAFIPFSDVHHMMMARKIIRDEKFYEIAKWMQRRVTNKVIVEKSDKKNQIDPEIVATMYNQYMNDLRATYL